MKAHVFRIFLFLLMSFLSVSSFAWAPAVIPPEYMAEIKKDWKPLYQKNGIQVFERLPKTTKEGPMAFRAIGIIKATPMKVLCLLRHVDSSSNWTPNLGEKKMLQEFTYLDAITYNRNKLPWPAMDRDVVMRSTLTVDYDLGHIFVQSHSVDHPAAPVRKDAVRGILYHSNFIFKPVEGGGTFVDIDADFDPKGSIPRFLVNFVQKDWVYDFLIRLEKESQVSALPPQKAFQTILDELEKKYNETQTKTQQAISSNKK